jgi:glycosyltransferase involved in cell wall biosynthesis
MEKVFSIIVPIGNVEGKVLDALRSAVRQDIPMSRYEIIIVNDFSSDASIEKAEYFSRLYPNITVVQGEQGAPGNARKTGVMLATGRYLLFLDPEDTLCSNVLGDIAAQMDMDRLDMMAMPYEIIGRSGRVMRRNDIFRLKKNPGKIITGRQFILDKQYRAPVLYAYRRSFIEESGVVLRSIYHNTEDFLPRILARCERIKYLPVNGYACTSNKNYYMKSYRPADVVGLLDAAQGIREDILHTFPNDKELCREVNARSSAYTLSAIKRAIRERFGNEKELINYAFQAHLLPVDNNWNLKRFMLNHCPNLFVHYYRLVARLRIAEK